MNILFTSLTYHPFKGGAESCIADLATAYVQQRHQVTVVTSRSLDTLPTRETRDGVDIVRIHYPPKKIASLRDAFRVVMRACSASVQLFSVIRKKRIDTVCLGLVGSDSVLVLLLHWLLRFKLIVYIHGGEIRSYVMVSRLIRWTLKKCLQKSYAVIAVSEDLKSETIAFLPATEPKIFVIPNGIPVIDLTEQRAYLHHRKYLLFVGRLHPVKGVDVLIKAFQQVSEQLPQLDLIIVGTGPLESSLKQMAREHSTAAKIFFLGDQERSTVFSLLKGCEFLILPSYAEGCPISVLEALAVGKMTIASRVKGTVDIIQHERNGVLFEAGDSEALSNLISRYATDLPARRQLEMNIRNRGMSEHDGRELAERHLDAYAGRRQRLRVCLISNFYYYDENCAGLSSYYFNLAKSLSDHGCDVSLITSENSSLNGESRKIRILRLKQRGSENHSNQSVLDGCLKVAERFRFSINAYRKVKELDRSSGVDVIIAPELFAPGLLVGFLKGKKLLTRIHTPTYIGDQYNDRSPLVGKTLSLIERAQAKRSRGLSVASEPLATLISKDWRIPRQQIRIIPNSVQVDWIRQLADEQLRQIPGDYLLYFGRLEKRKGVHIIGQALPQILSRHPHLKMVFAGRDAGLKDEILKLNDRCHDRIVFLDTMEKGKLFGLIKYSRLVLLPSLFENMSNAGLEAMSLGRPIVGTRKTSFEGIIDDNVNGFLVEPGDPQALSAKVLACLEMEDLEQVGENAFQSTGRFDSRNVVSQNIEFYRQAISTS